MLLNPVGRTLAAAALTAADLRQQRHRRGIVVFGYFGEARREKGFHLLPEIVEKLIGIYGAKQVQFAIQVSAAPDNDTDEVRAARARLERLSELHKVYGAIRLYQEFPDMHGYYRALSGCDALLMPYGPGAYQLRGSGVALEGLALGIPIIVPAGTDMAVTFAGQGCIVANTCTAEAIAQACTFVVDNMAAVSAGVQNYLARSPVVQSESEFISTLIEHVPSVPARVPEERPIANYNHKLCRRFLLAVSAADLQRSLAQWLQYAPGLTPSINCRRRLRTVDRINKRQMYGGYRVTEVVNSFPERSNYEIPHGDTIISQ